MDSVHIHNTACPACRKNGWDLPGDNLAVYSDGHEYCFACGYHSGHSPFSSLRTDKHVKPIERKLHLPGDSCLDYPLFVTRWIEQYGLDITDCYNNGFLYSESGVKCGDKQAINLLIFPFWDSEGNLIAYQARYFGKDKSIPKYTGRGKLDSLYHFLWEGRSLLELRTIANFTDTIVITEDLISAIKVSKCGIASMPLFGNNFKNRINTLRLLTDIPLESTRKRFKALLWLDPDMSIKSIKESSIGRLKGLEVNSVFSKYDPKEHTLNEIKEYLNGYKT